jgi:hypothetical protein
MLVQMYLYQRRANIGYLFIPHKIILKKSKITFSLPGELL